MSELAHRIRDLEAEERSLSARRARLQNRIDFLRSGGGRTVEEPDALADLQRQEREVSSRRREVHAEIEVARAELIRTRG